MRLAVVGATGVMGRLVVAEARARGHDVVPVARSVGVDVVTGEGLDAALEGADAVVDAFNRQAQRASAARRAFTAAAGHLAVAARRAGLAHWVVLSIVGIDHPGLRRMGYYQAKLAQERMAAGSGVPHSIARTTAWFEFADLVLATASLGPVSLVPRMRLRPVAGHAVARHLVGLAEGEPAGRARELAGPEEMMLPDLVRRVLAARGERRRVVVVPFPGPPSSLRAVAGGALLPGPEARLDPTTLDDWLRGE